MLHFKTHIIRKDSPWLVFIHGAGGNSGAWQRQWNAFKDYGNLLAMDLRDHGKSKNIKPEKTRYDFDLIAEDILNVIDYLQIKSASFITLSFGSVLMQDLSMRRPHLVEKVVMAGGIFKGNLAVKSFVHFARFLNLFLSYRTMYSIFSYILMPKKRHQLSRRIYQIHSQKLNSDEYLKWLGLYSKFFLTLKRFYNQPIDFPALVVMGADDYVFLKAAKDFTAKHDKVEISVIENAGHICNIDNEEEFNRIVHEFLIVPSVEKQTSLAV